METSPNSKSLFNYYNAYKVILGLLLYLLVLSEHSYLKQFRSLAYFDTLTIVYLVLNLFSLLLYRFYIKVKPKQIFALLIIDIIFLHAIFFYGTGIANGLGNLIIISVAAGNIIIRGRIGLSFAAVAAILSLLVEIERFLTSQNQENDIAQSGLIGIMYFASAFILQSLSKRITENESLLKQQEQDLLELEKLNHQIIQSMRTGIIVCSQDQKIKLINEACKDLLNLEDSQKLPVALEERFNHWQQQPLNRTTPFKVNANLPMVQANFSRLHTNGSSNVLIFIEDTRKTAQQAQQLKLASLGRLTASIAHEVRNPLGAISHATQLLAESENLDFADMKMIDIIQRHSQRVNQIIENTLQLSRRSEPSIENILITPWLEKIIYDFEVQTRHKSEDQRIFVLSNNKDLSALFDPNQMEQVIINLIENAIHHGEKQLNDLCVFIFIGETKDQNQVFIDVIDQGAGISSENIEHLFEPFFTTESQGTGLGLYLSREICEANQAQLEFLDPYTNYAQWQTPPSTENPVIQKLNDTRKFGACFRVMLAHNKRIL
jgi:two-component system sensor histidine kinase PilS (NtrC family)